jgi:hypothetical protein
MLLLGHYDRPGGYWFNVSSLLNRLLRQHPRHLDLHRLNRKLKFSRHRSTCSGPGRIVAQNWEQTYSAASVTCAVCDTDVDADAEVTVKV